MASKPIKVVAFDLDNTLYDENLYFEQVIIDFCRRHNLNPQPFTSDFLEIPRTSKDLFKDLLEKRAIFTPALQEELFHIYGTLQVKLQPYSSLDSVLEYLRSRDMRLAIVTNGDVKVQMNKIACLGLDRRFDLIVYARQWGKAFEKPHPKPYQFLLDKFLISAQEVLFVGDREDTDIRGAKAIGMPYFKPSQSSDLLIIKELDIIKKIYIE